MARIRTIKPDFFTSEDIVGLSPLARLLYIATWLEADRDGRMVWRPGTLKLRYLPGDDCSVDDLAAELTLAGLIVLYEVEGQHLAHVPTFTRHQVINNRETPSSLPAPTDARATRAPRVDDACRTRQDATGTPLVGKEGKGKEGKEGREARPSVSSAVPTVPCPYDAIVELYHRWLPSLPQVRLMSDDRQRALRKRWGWILSSSKPDGTRRATTSEEALAWLATYFERAAANDFLMGRGQRSEAHANWRCDLDFLMTDKGMRHVIEKTEAAA